VCKVPQRLNCNIKISKVIPVSGHKGVPVPPDVISLQLCTPKVFGILTSGSPVANPKSGLDYSKFIMIFFFNFTHPVRCFRVPQRCLRITQVEDNYYAKMNRRRR
jgi:hypothetical protein